MCVSAALPEVFFHILLYMGFSLSVWGISSHCLSGLYNLDSERHPPFFRPSMRTRKNLPCWDGKKETGRTYTQQMSQLSTWAGRPLLIWHQNWAHCNLCEFQKQTNPTIVLSFHVGEIAPKVPAIIPICKIHALKPENLFKDKKKKKRILRKIWKRWWDEARRRL